MLTSVILEQNVLQKWNILFCGLYNTNVVDVYVNYLRAKIDKGFEDKLIHTVVGVGYMMTD